MSVLANRVKVATSTTGFGAIDLDAAVTGFQSFSDGGVTNGQVVSYAIEDGAAWEIGTGTYTTGTPDTLSRTVIESSNSDAAINLSGSAVVFITALSGDLQKAVDMDQGVATTDSPSFAGLSATGDVDIADKIVHTGDTNTAIRFPAADTVTVETAGTERVRIDSSGNLLVGTTSTLTIAGISASHAFISSGVWSAGFRDTSGSAPWGVVVEYSGAAPNNSTQNFLFCTDTAGQKFSVRSDGGIANFSANNVNLSDERVKTDIVPIGSYWDKIKAVEVVTFKYKDQTHDDDNIGVIAQQVESVAPEFVSNDGFGETPQDGVPLKSVYEADLHYAILKALQEAMARIETLEARVAALEA
jgi:hypothetical protein